MAAVQSCREVDVLEARRLETEGAVLVDVREIAEWEAGRAPGARHLPLSHLAERLHEIPPDRTVLLICRSGRRSAQAAAFIEQRNDRVDDVVNVGGGMLAWSAAGLPVVTGSGLPGAVA